MKLAGFSCALICAFTLSGCLEATKVAPMRPVQENEAAHSVTLSLPRAALAEIARSAEQLVIHAFKVDKGAVGSELRDAYKFPITDNGLYALDGLPLGEVEFQVTLLDGSGQTLADGNLRAVINPGAQTLPPVTLKPKKPTAVDLNFRVALNLVNFPDAPVQTPAEPEAVRNVFKTYKCQTCHNSGARPSGGLDLQSFPYKNQDKETLVQILNLVVSSFTGSNDVPKMPPNNTVVKDEDQAAVKGFLQTVNDALNAGSKRWVEDVQLSIATGGGGRFEATLTLQDGVYVLTDRINLMAGSRYPYTLTVHGPGGSKLYEVADGALDVPLDGKVQQNLDISYQAPAVTLPVVVQPSDN